MWKMWIYCFIIHMNRKIKQYYNNHFLFVSCNNESLRPLWQGLVQNYYLLHICSPPFVVSEFWACKFITLNLYYALRNSTVQQKYCPWHVHLLYAHNLSVLFYHVVYHFVIWVYLIQNPVVLFLYWFRFYSIFGGTLVYVFRHFSNQNRCRQKKTTNNKVTHFVITAAVI